MKKRILSIICIIFLMFTITAPICSNYFVYAEDTPQEQLTTSEIIEAGITTYLNTRGAWLVNAYGDSVYVVKSVMQTWINSAEFWSNTQVYDQATLAANIIIKYSPFRVSLKGPAVRAFNDLVQWLIDNGKLGNLEQSNGGQTSDNVYDGALLGGNLIYIFHSTDTTNTGTTNYLNMSHVSDVDVGRNVDGVNSEFILNQYMATNPSANFNENIQQNDQQSISININYASDLTYTASFIRRNTGSNVPAEIKPFISTGTLCPVYSKRLNQLRGGAAWFRSTADPANQFRYGIVSYNYTTEQYILWIYGTYTRNDTIPYLQAGVNFDTDNFNKTDPTPPEEGDEEDLTPRDKTTGDTFNTYNEYINNYITKNTVINQTVVEEAGGTEPPWTDQDTTVDPDGNGGFNLSLPDLTIPDLNIDWNITGLKEKFPFSIPWDLLAFFTVLNAEPETPAIEAQIDLGIVNWDIDWDLHNFDTLAVLLRNLEFIGFCLALILITRSIIKG